MLRFACRRPKLLCPSQQQCRYGYVHVPKKTRPHILGRGSTWRKCFVVHPQTQMLDPLAKYQWLTNSTVVSGLPERLASLQLPEEEELLERFKTHCEETLAFQRMEGQSWKRESLAAFVASALTGVWLIGAKDPHSHLARSNLTFDPKLECFWRHKGVNLICRSRPLSILHTSTPHQVFSGPADSPGESFPPISYHPALLGLFEHSFDQISPFGGCRRYAPFSFAHTVFISDHKSRSREQLLAHGMMELFCRAAGESVQNGYKLKSDLPFPLATQGIITNGREFTFVCYQLNTLSMTSGERQNILWAGPTHELYVSLNAGQGLEGVDYDCARMILQFLLHPPSGRAPHTSGFPPSRSQKSHHSRLPVTADSCETSDTHTSEHPV